MAPPPRPPASPAAPPRAPKRRRRSGRAAREKRTSLRDGAARAARKPAFKPEMGSAFSFRWPVLDAADTGRVVERLRAAPAVARARARREAAAAAAAAARASEEGKEGAAAAAPPTGGGGDPGAAAAVSARAQRRRGLRRARQERARQRQLLAAAAAPAARAGRGAGEEEAGGGERGGVLAGLSEVMRACERGEVGAVVICRDALQPESSAAARLAQQLPALCHRHGVALCCLHRTGGSPELLGALLGLKRCIALGFRRPTAQVGAAGAAAVQGGSGGGDGGTGALEWLVQRCPPPSMPWLPKADAPPLPG
jgi:ribosomal protein L7Ae-like RNA K-turn-binding protein